MKKRLLLLLLVLVCMFVCVVGLVACDNGDNHTHDYATTWSKNATDHWHECKKDGCDAKEKDKAAHADTDGDGKCDVCEYAMGGTQTVAVTGVTLNKNELTLEIGGEETLTATVAPDNATDKTVTWSVSPAGIVTVDNDGKVTAIAAGDATITATAGDKTADCAVTVNEPIPQELEYTLNNDNESYCVSGLGTVTSADIVIASEYNGLPVTAIGDYAFWYCKTLTSVTIPDSVTSIGNYAFAYCSFTSIKIPNRVSSIGMGAFSQCTSLKSITIPDSVTKIDTWAFEYCGALTIYCEAESKPDGWHSAWNVSNRPVNWGYKSEEN